MEQELISKKELLERTGISYGQLYRWKRKQLIPEEWFIRKATFTGQETFFPRQLVLSRIDHIVQFKEDLSLDQLADRLSPLQADIRIREEELRSRSIVSADLLARYAGPFLQEGALSFDLAFYLYVLDQLGASTSSALSDADGRRLLRLLQEHYPQVEGKQSELIMLGAQGLSLFMLQCGFGELYTDEQATVSVRLSLGELMESFKMKLYSFEA
ncbi:conserved hypothetical protein [Paenibacillus curdlanolyticus YK9]|uniref:Uncharacterized protein n=1 Tax=Paenibacillus curdlanolyticus YK9 TaxID=717606 RepID=E0IB84_9BACL|nr:DUF4004 family protein [Paenibacillus curdlanolyticus]EFM10375.1 conserved hypothetical protein [Paenibacillus curdlanolyticus YK9]